MIVNGSISALSSGGTSLDESGDPEVVTSTWEDAIPCHIKSIKHDKKAVYADGKFIQASYEILIEKQEFDAEMVQLTDEFETVLGEFNVQDIQFLNFVGKVKITV